MQSPVRLTLDSAALVHNYRALAKASGGAATGAAVKADGYGLGARNVVALLSDAGACDFFVAHWSEAAAIADLVPAAQISVLNGVGDADMAAALSLGAVPMLNNPQQIQRWKQGGGGRCHVMIDSGINRLGIGPEQIADGLFDGLDIDICASHLASADENSGQNARQLACFLAAAAHVPAKRRSFANSAGIMLGADYHFDLTRPGIALYGGIPRADMADMIRQVAYPKAQVIQIRMMPAGSLIGYNATYQCASQKRVATISLGYADGFRRAFSNAGAVSFGGMALPVIGRVSMDLVVLDADQADGLTEGDWVTADYALSEASEISGISQYELLTGLGHRFDRIWG
ncbi:MAG: alanine racemase [Sphingorhabdus sp.]|nr:alanine racemase [Sphingorhabdus sp.]